MADGALENFVVSHSAISEVFFCKKISQCGEHIAVLAVAGILIALKRTSYLVCPLLAYNRNRKAVMKMHDMIERSDRTSNANEKPESCYCSALPKGSGRKKMSGRS